MRVQSYYFFGDLQDFYGKSYQITSKSDTFKLTITFANF